MRSYDKTDIPTVGDQARPIGCSVEYIDGHCIVHYCADPACNK